MTRTDDMEPARTSPPKFTLQDYMNFPDDGLRHEIIDGEHYVSATPILRHQLIAMRIIEAFVFYLRDRPLGKLFPAPLAVILSDNDVVEPDLMFISNERAAIMQDWVRGAPDLVIEILSPSTRKVDEVIKRRLFDRVGAREYWVVDHELEMIKVFRRAEGGAFPRVAELTSEHDDVLTTPLLPELTIRLSELFRPT
jgi:Uma2 family endonuclease